MISLVISNTYRATSLRHTVTFNILQEILFGSATYRSAEGLIREKAFAFGWVRVRVQKRSCIFRMGGVIAF